MAAHGTEEGEPTTEEGEPTSPSLELALTGVREPIVRAVSEMGISRLTPVQVRCLPHCLAGSDILAKAKTGTGKTLAFLIPTVERLQRNTAATNDGIDPVRALVLSSTRELAAQIVTQAEGIAKFLPGFNIEIVLGGSAIANQRMRLDRTSKGEFAYSGIVDLMIATPGRLIEHIENTNEFQSRLLGVETLILDEVDQLLDGGFQRALETIIAKLPQRRHTLCFSATVPDKLKRVLGMALQDEHIVVDCVGKEEVDTHASIEQHYMVHSLEHSMLMLYSSVRAEIQKRPDDYKILVFMPTAKQTEFSAAALKNMGLGVMEIHSRIKQNQRVLVSDSFRAGNKMVLLSSDVSARGVDYPDVTLVIQISAPTSCEVYVQRLGRTGRAGKSGAGLLLLCEYEKGFLQKLKGLPVQAVSVDHSPEDLRRAQEAARLVDEDLAVQTFRAWIAASVGVRKAYKWSKQDMVNNANLFAREVLGREALLPLQREFAVLYGLQGLDGLSIVDGLPSVESGISIASCIPSVGSSASLAGLEETLVVKAIQKAIRPALKANAKSATEAIEALSEPEVLALKAKIDAEGQAEVAGFMISSECLTFTTVTKGPQGTTIKVCGVASVEPKEGVAVDAPSITFPNAGAVEGVKSKARSVIEFNDVSFRYGNEEDFILSEISGKLCLESRVAICGSGACGKSTLMQMICSELKPMEGKGGQTGEIVRTSSLRLAYMRQDHMKYLDACLDSSPLDYISKRFQHGYDAELQQRLMQTGGMEEAESKSISAEAAGSDKRPLTRREIKKHVETFGIDEEMCCNGKIRGLSASQKVCLSLAAMFWTKPHYIAVDEFAKDLDIETTKALSIAFQNFKGGILLIEPEGDFVEKVCTETWTLEHGLVTVAKTANGMK